jgi:cephalosporin hydroxylase
VKRLSTIVAIIGVFLAIFAVVYEQMGSARIIIGGAKILTTQLLMLAVFWIVSGLVVKITAGNGERPSQEGEKRSSLWIVIATVLLGSVALWEVGSRRLFSREEIVEQFYLVYYEPERLKTTYLGIASLQYPTDNWAMQEIISEVKPDFIVETGTNAGGTALFYASLLERVNDQGKVITVDVGEPDPRVFTMPLWQERVEFIRGSSTAKEVYDKIISRVRGKKVLVTFDSLHTKDHVLNEMKLYWDLVSPGSYMVVQDTQLMGHPIPLRIYSHEGKEGPWEAVEEFLSTNKSFIIDKSRERFLLTANPSGFLKRVK